MNRVKRITALLLACLLMVACVPAAGTQTEAAHKHTWQFKSRTYPTCHEAGKTVYKCKCGAQKTVAAKKLNHSYLMIHNVTPTCTKNGYYEYKCSYCGDKKTVYRNAYGHKWVGTHLTKGNKKIKTWFKCSRCQVRKFMY